MNFGEAKTRANYTDKFEMLLTRACIGCYAVKVRGGGYNGQLYWGVDKGCRLYNKVMIAYD
jgi:hypothetical protein